jgi:regulator of nucleoside diphosphate kinase
MTEPIIVTTGIYDLIKECIHRKRVTRAEEELLLSELKTAVQMIRRELPSGIVDVGTRVLIKDHTSSVEKEYELVGVGKSKPSKGKYPIDSPIALATIGRKEGTILQWPFKDGLRKIEIVRVTQVA